MRTSGTSLLSCTGQSWKLTLAIIGGLGYCAFLAAIEALWFGGRIAEEIRALSLPSGAALALGSFVFACLDIRCPNCGMRWFWSGVSRKDDGVRLLFSRPACPKCGKSCGTLMEITSRRH
jgi:hypothetical protein